MTSSVYKGIGQIVDQLIAVCIAARTAIGTIRADANNDELALTPFE
jgi:hypothetical protein